MPRPHRTLLVAAIAATALAADFKSEPARKAQARYEQARAEATLAFDSALRQARDDYRHALARLIKSSTQVGELDEAARLQAELNALPSAEQAVPAIPATSFNGHRYLLIRSRMTWHQAHAVCASLGGRLVAITSAEEQAFVTRFAAGERAWIGATDAEEEGVWRWITGEPFDYKAWQSRQPDNHRGEHHSHLFNDGTWNDASATDNSVTAFICEWE